MVTKGTDMPQVTELFSILNSAGNNPLSTKKDLSFKDLLSSSKNNTNFSKDLSIKTGVTEKREFVQDESVYTNNKSGLINSDKTSTISNPTDSTKVGQEKDVLSLEQMDEATEAVNDFFESVDDVLASVKKVIIDMLDLTEEELTKMMETLGLSMSDLLKPEGLMKLLLSNAGIEESYTLLTDEGLANKFQQLLQSVEQILKQSEIPKEDMLHTLDTKEFTEYFNAKTSMEENVEEPGLKKQQNHLGITEKAADLEEKSNAPKINVSIEKVTDESESDAKSTDAKSQGFDKTDTKATAGAIVEQMVTSTQRVEMGFQGQITTITTMKDIVNQIVEQIKVVIRPSQTSMELQLTPENLGKVSLTVSSKGGVMTAQFTVQSEVAKEAIESQMQVLRQNLENQGMRVESIEVSVSDFSFDQNNAMKENEEGSRRSKKPFREQFDHTNETEQDFVLASGLVDENTRNVDYSA